MVRWLALVVAGGVLTGCGPRGRPAEPPAALEEQRLAEILLAADRADGVEDKVVARCAVCGLAMEGSPHLASTYADVTFYHCSPHCRELFDRDPVKVLQRLELPPPPAAAP